MLSSAFANIKSVCLGGTEYSQPCQGLSMPSGLGSDLSRTTAGGVHTRVHKPPLVEASGSETNTE